MNSTTSKSSVTVQILLAVVAIALGYLLLFSSTAQVRTLCQFLCGAVIAVGAASIASFFLSGDYKRIDRYGFALGAMLILLGLAGLIRINDITLNFEIYTGILSLILGVLVLQGGVQVKVLDYAAWILQVVISLFCLSGAFCVLTEVTAVTDRFLNFSSWVLLICGVSCLLSMLITWICTILAKKREKKMEKEREEAAQREAKARAEAEEQARRDELARKAAEEKARQEAVEAARREAAAQAQAKLEQQAREAAQAQAKLEQQAREAAQAQSAPQNDLPPVETPELVFGQEDTGENKVQ